MRMISWSDRRYYDIGLDRDIARVSGFDDHHQEHWVEVEVGKGFAERRKEALFLIMDSIESGNRPGKIKI